MSEAKPQDGNSVKGYRTLNAGDIERMNRLKGISRYFCSLLDTERDVAMAEVVKCVSHAETERSEALPGNRPHQNAGSLHVSMPRSSAS